MVTEYDEEFETLCSQLDLIKSATEKMVSYVETIAEPNPSECVCVCTCVCVGMCVCVYVVITYL